MVLKPLLRKLRDALEPRRSTTPYHAIRRQVGPFDSFRDYERVADQWAGLLIERCALRPDARVLDAGCGCGQVAGPLIPYLKAGSYHGFDIQPALIDWSTENLSRKYPRFSFAVADVYNGVYNPKGTTKSSEYSFPFPDASFDAAIAKSLFTHMLPAELERYLNEISRVLKPGGRCLITYFLLDGRPWSPASMDFAHDLGACRTVDAEHPESALAYDQARLFALYEKAGLELEPPVHYGRWREVFDVNDFQDFVVARKRGGAA